MTELKPCLCGGTPEVKETWDTLRICCPKCGRKTPIIFGDYYDEAFMFATYGETAIKEWNEMIKNDEEKAVRRKMLVRNLLHRQKYWTPITICGGSTPKTFFSKDFGGTKEERWRATEEYGDRIVRYFYFSTDYNSQPWKRLRKFRWVFLKLFFWINPQCLYIEVYDESECTVQNHQNESVIL